MAVLRPESVADNASEQVAVFGRNTQLAFIKPVFKSIHNIHALMQDRKDTGRFAFWMEIENIVMLAKRLTKIWG